MKNKLLILGISLLMFSACEVTVTDTTSDNGGANRVESDFHVGDVQKTRHLPTEYYIKDVMAYTWNSSSEQAKVYSSVCEEQNLKLVWKPDYEFKYTLTFYDYSKYF